MKGKIPCRICGKPHIQRFIKGRGMELDSVTWEMDGHNYHPIDKDKFIDILSRENKKLKRLLRGRR